MNRILNVPEPEIYTKTNFFNSEFTEVKTNEFFYVEMQYPLLKMKNAESKCLVRKEVYERLIKAVKFLPSGYRLKILDAWRPFALQRELYFTYSEKIIKKFNLYDFSDYDKKIIISKYVSEPVENKNLPPVHTTGGAVDVTIIGRDNQELYMGTGFDDFTEKTRTSYFEDNSDFQNVKENRRLLYYVMTSAGFTNLPSEWWHYDYGDRFWAFYCNKPAVYNGVFSKEEIY